MITWMQKHKKYLVVTIWVSTIAFVGAGFVGWGAYDLNKNRATSVATVGHRNVSVQELQQKYNELYNYYNNNIFGGKLTQEKANELKLEELALKATIRENLLLNFADDLGLSVSDEDILKYIVADNNFQVDGVFNKNLYYDVLRRARINPNDFEKNLKRVVLLDKLNFALNIPNSQKDIELMTASLFIEDKLAIELIDANESEITVNEDELKKFWEDRKNNYMTKTVYELDTLFVEPVVSEEENATTIAEYYNENKDRYKGSDDKILAFDDVKDLVKRDYELEQSKSKALEKYIAVKKGELATNDKMSVSEDNASFDIAEVKDVRVGETIKPFVFENGYLIAKIKDITPPQAMSYEQARESVLKIYKEDKIKEQLENKAKEALQNFKGKDIGFISMETNHEIEGLDMLQTPNFISRVFSSPEKKGYVLLDDKVVVYEILEQKLKSVTDENYKQLIEQNVMALKNSELMNDLTRELTKRYAVKEYVKR